MDRAGPPRPPRSRRWRWLAAGLGAAGASLLGLGCAQPMARLIEYGPAAGPAPRAGVVQASDRVPAPGATRATHEVPVTLDAVLRLAEEHNARIGLARERVNESSITTQLECRCWREGGFRCVKAKGQVWQSKVELSQARHEVLLDAANTYLDLLTARRGEAVVRELEGYEQKQLRRAEKLRKDDPAAGVLEEGLRATLADRQRTLSQLRQQGSAAAAKLGHLLGLPPDAVVVPGEAVAPLDLVDGTAPAEDLVAQALATGPGVRELEGVLRVIEDGLAQAGCLATLMPTRIRLAESKLRQAHLSYQDLRGKLTAGVREAREAILSGREQIGLSTQQLRHARESYRLSDRRLEQGAMGASSSEVLTSIRALEQAHFNHLSAVRDFDKAQVRLLLLLGQPNYHSPPACRP
jgi:outer membrane protein TolC